MSIWNSVDKRLPFHSRPVLCYITDFNFGIYIDHYDKEFGWVDAKLIGSEPTHWMELPRPPIKLG